MAFKGVMLGECSIFFNKVSFLATVFSSIQVLQYLILFYVLEKSRLFSHCFLKHSSSLALYKESRSTNHF